jgi:FMN-dependent NADH-azoreductase
MALRFCCCNGAGVAGRNATVRKPYMLGHSSSLAQLSRYLRRILGFIGIEDVQTVRAEGTNIPPLAIHAVPNREKAVAALVI